jgi:hypothetical protein
MVLLAEKVDSQNAALIDRISRSRVFWNDVVSAREAIPALKTKTLLHAGPPLRGAPMCSAMANAAYGALLYEGWARDLREAHDMVEDGQIEFLSAHDHSALGPMAGIISPSMPLLVLQNVAFGNRAYVTINEGLGRTLRFGANDSAVIGRLRWLEQALAPLLKEAISLSGPLDVTEIMSRAVQRGDECHNRNKSATSLFIRKLAPWLVKSSFSKDDIAKALFFLDGNDHVFLNFSMAATKAIMGPAHEVPGSSIVTCMAANGVEFGIKVAGCGDKWYTAPAVLAGGKYFPGFGEDQANPVMGDSYISEACGLGGIALAMAPAIVSFIGGTVEEAFQSTLEMYRITVAEHPLYKIPAMGFRGSPLGIDVRSVVRTGIAPLINTGIAHKEPGVGQIGAGQFRAPLECFRKASIDLSLA